MSYSTSTTLILISSRRTTYKDISRYRTWGEGTLIVLVWRYVENKYLHLDVSRRRPDDFVSAWTIPTDLPYVRALSTVITKNNHLYVRSIQIDNYYYLRGSNIPSLRHKRDDSKSTIDDQILLFTVEDAVCRTKICRISKLNNSRKFLSVHCILMETSFHHADDILCLYKRTNWEE